ncbi:MAG: FtsX-like permease family protein [Anaerolineae bacterium]|nr:FtsX-like permease family protein [Anaerolineae bacterium]
MKFLNPRWRKVIRDLADNKARTALVVLSIAVGVLAVGVVSGTRSIFGGQLETSYAATNPPSASLVVNGDFDQSVVDTIRAMREIEAAEGRRVVSARYRVGPDDEWKPISLEARAMNDYDRMNIAKLWPEQGDWPPPEKAILVERTSLDWMGLEVGDSITLRTLDGYERTMRIAGTVHDVGERPAPLAGQAFGFISLDTLAWLRQPAAFNRVEFVVAQDKSNQAHVEAVAKEVSRKIEGAGLEIMSTVNRRPGDYPVNDVVQPLLLLLNASALLALGLSGFLVINTISAILAQQTRQIGVMKAIGGQQGQIMNLYFATVLAYGLLSLFLAVPLGVVGAWRLAGYLSQQLNFDLVRTTMSPEVLLIQVAIGLLTPLLAALYPIVAGVRVSVREAISNYGLGQGTFGESWLDRLLQRLRGLSRPLMLSLRNTFRRKDRLLLTLITLSVAGMAFIAIFSVRASLEQTLDDALNYWQFDIRVRFEGDYRVREIEQIALEVPGVTVAESWGAKSVRRLRPEGVEGEAVLLLAPEADTTMIQATLLEGRWLRPDDTNALVVNTDFLYDEPDLGLGDVVILKFGERQTNWQIVGIIRGTLAGPMLYANYPYYTRAAHEVGRAASVQIITQANDMESLTQTARQLEQKFNRAGFKVAEVRTIMSLRENVQLMLNILIVFLLAVAVLLAVVGGLGLMGTMSINVLERTREIGVMRAIGASDGAILRIVIVEGIVIGVLSWVSGTLLAVPLSKILSDLTGQALFQAPLSYIFSLPGVALWLVVAILLAALASFLPARSASRLTVREVLAYE